MTDPVTGCTIRRMHAEEFDVARRVAVDVLVLSPVGVRPDRLVHPDVFSRHDAVGLR